MLIYPKSHVMRTRTNWMEVDIGSDDDDRPKLVARKKCKIVEESGNDDLLRGKEGTATQGTVDHFDAGQDLLGMVRDLDIEFDAEGFDW